MVRTRTQNMIIDQKVDQFTKEVRAMARRLSVNRIMTPQSPSKVAKRKQKQQLKRDSDKIKKILLTTKNELKKVCL